MRKGVAKAIDGEEEIELARRKGDKVPQSATAQMLLRLVIVTCITACSDPLCSFLHLNTVSAILRKFETLAQARDSGKIAGLTW